MIVSHKHRYLFVEIPHTASTAISRELRENYAGISILTKHATYPDFLKQATAEEKSYFVFAGIRNPLDETVSIYFKYKSNHKQDYTTPRRLAKYGGSITGNVVSRYEFIQTSGADFATYFKKYYKLPYYSLISLSCKYCNFIIRFENLQEDFARALELMGLEQVRPLPQANKTAQRRAGFETYYPPSLIGQAKRVFGPFMKEWGYEFPPEWGENSTPWFNDVAFQSLTTARNFYWQHVRRSPHFYGRLIRGLLR